MHDADTHAAPSLADRLIAGFDHALRVCTGTVTDEVRANPARDVESAPLDARERRHAAGLMRVNHAGEVAAQALYEGQALTARDPQVREAMRVSAAEEADHLAWCNERVTELGASVSRLNPLWYAGSFGIGALAGLFGDRVSLGFIAETERQVVAHLARHLARLPDGDARSRRILEQMQHDEARHRDHALDAGGAELPVPVRRAMTAVSKVMTRTAYWL